MRNFEQASEFISACHKQGVPVWLRNDSYNTAYLNPPKEGEEADWIQYLNYAARMSLNVIQRRGYVSLFLIAANGCGVKHIRVTYDSASGQFEAHYLD